MFSEDFLWGAASASCQIEGAYNEDGKCLSIWDVADGHINNNDNCHIACDHYHRYKDDVKIMKELGLKSYRFSVSWCRIMPSEGVINPKGIEFYRSLVKELKANGIEPMVTLYHWDLPVWVHKLGGWKNPKTIELFLDYTRAVVEALSNDVTYWMTFNELRCFLLDGELTGKHAPFERHPRTIGYYIRNVLLAHGKAVKLIREVAIKPPKIGFVMAASAYAPHNESAIEIEKARRITFEEKIGISINSLFLDPMFLHKDPMYLKGKLSEEDYEIISEKIDFIGINNYEPFNSWIKDKEYKNFPRTFMDWVVDGKGLYWIARFYYERYKMPIMITENGAAFTDIVENGRVHDQNRIDYIKDYLTNLKRAINEGIPILGYQYWSIMDNFEWTKGYGPRFGIVRVDYDTQKRIIKDSGYYYKSIIENNGNNI